MNRHAKPFKSTTILTILISIFAWISPVNADPPLPEEPGKTNMEGAQYLDQSLQPITPEETELSVTSTIDAANVSPNITVWYESSLQFGHLGNAQERIDILGNVSDPDGSVRSLTYRLNGGSAMSIPIGPDARRLARQGDFVAAIPISALRDGANTIAFTATDNNGGVRTKSVSFNYTSGKVWPMPYSIRWASAASIHSVAQVVDGLWNLSSSGVRPAQVGYDRIVAVGDINWTDYEVLVPITIHSFHPDPANPSDSGGVGIITRWQGHTGTKNPPDDWRRLGAYGYYSNRLGRLALRLSDSEIYTQSFSFSFNRTYMFRMRAETVSGGTRYSFKVWESGKPEPSWSDPAFSSIVNRVDTNSDLPKGSVLLVAHRTDATFGDVTICPLNLTYPLNVSLNGGGRVTRQPNKTNYQCGEGVTLTATAEPGWAFTGWTGDITSSANPLSFNMTRGYNLTVNFRQAQTQPLNHKTYLPFIRR